MEEVKEKTSENVEQETKAEPKEEGLSPSLETASTNAEETSTQPESESETIDQKLTRLSQSKADQIIAKTFMPKLTEAQKLLKEKEDELAKLKSESFQRKYQKFVDDNFQRDVESLGEDKAETNKKTAEEIQKKILWMDDNYDKVMAIQTENESKLNDLAVVERDQRAFREILPILHPELKAVIDEVTKYVEKFANVKDEQEFDLVKESIQVSLSNKKKFKPASSGQAGGGINLDELSPREKINQGIENAKKKKGG